MSPRNTGGKLDMAAYAAMTNEHRPNDSEKLADEVRRLHRCGHSKRFIADTLRLTPEMVAEVLAEDASE